MRQWIFPESFHQVHYQLNISKLPLFNNNKKVVIPDTYPCSRELPKITASSIDIGVP